MSTELAPILRVVDAQFVRAGETLVAPFSLTLVPGERARLDAPNARVAWLRARMLAGVVKATAGTLSIGDYDPRIQPVQAKRLVGFVSAEIAPPGGRLERAAIVAHADLWGVDRAAAEAAAGAVLARLDGSDPFVRAFALALIRPVALLVLDRPPPEFVVLADEFLNPSSAAVSNFVYAPAVAPAPRLAASRA